MAGWVAGAIAVSSLIGANASKSAANKQADAGQKSIDAQTGMFNKTQENIAPFVATGQQYSNTLADLGKTDYATHQFGTADLKNGLSPNYDWVKQQGLMAANNAASVQGGLGGTNAQRSAIDYAENLAGNAYQQAFSNYNSQRNSIFGNLNSIASLGSNAAVGQGNIAQKTGDSIGSTLTGIGNAQAAGQVGVSNSITGGFNNYLGYNYLSNVGKTPGAGGSTGGSGGQVADSAWVPQQPPIGP